MPSTGTVQPARHEIACGPIASGEQDQLDPGTPQRLARRARVSAWCVGRRKRQKEERNQHRARDLAHCPGTGHNLEFVLQHPTRRRAARRPLRHAAARPLPALGQDRRPVGALQADRTTHARNWIDDQPDATRQAETSPTAPSACRNEYHRWRSSPAVCQCAAPAVTLGLGDDRRCRRIPNWPSKGLGRAVWYWPSRRAILTQSRCGLLGSPANSRRTASTPAAPVSSTTCRARPATSATRPRVAPTRLSRSKGSKPSRRAASCAVPMTDCAARGSALPSLADGFARGLHQVLAHRADHAPFLAAGGHQQADRGTDRNSQRAQQKRLVLHIVDGPTAHAARLTRHAAGAPTHVRGRGAPVVVDVSRHSPVGRQLLGFVAGSGCEGLHLVERIAQCLLNALAKARRSLAGFPCKAERRAAGGVNALRKSSSASPA